MGAPSGRRVDLHTLPRFGDGWTFLYVEQAKIDREDGAISIRDVHGTVPVPAAALSVLMLGPGVSVTHAAMVLMGDHGTSVAWVGESGVRFYASGLGETTQATHLEHQAKMWADPVKHMEVVTRMYRMRFSSAPDPTYTLQQLRGMEGARVRDAYAHAAKQHGIDWQGRNYKQTDWSASDPVNRALSSANACLYGLCHAAIVSTGFSPGLGFIHTGRMQSFVYDVADLYKIELCVPAAFEAAKRQKGVEPVVRKGLRDLFFKSGLVARILPDIQMALGLSPEKARAWVHTADESGIAGLWDPAGAVPGGQNHTEPTPQDGT